MERRITRLVNPQFEIQYSDEKVMPWGGMRLMKEELERSGASGLLGELTLPEPEATEDMI